MKNRLRSSVNPSRSTKRVRLTRCPVTGEISSWVTYPERSADSNDALPEMIRSAPCVSPSRRQNPLFASRSLSGCSGSGGGSTSRMSRLVFLRSSLRNNPTISLSRSTPGSSLSRSEEHTSELQSLAYLVCRLLLEKKKKKKHNVVYRG